MKKEELIYIPVFMPLGDGEVSSLELGQGVIYNDALVVKFNNKLPSAAILHAIQRGEVVGITFVAPGLQAAAEENLSQEERDARDLELLASDEEVTPESLEN